MVRGDSALLAAAIANAISNGLKFGKQVAIQLTVDGSMALLRVSEDGPGISPEERDRVFEPFFRSSAAKPGSPAGHGLGLALIRHVAEIHERSARFVENTNPGATLEISRAVPTPRSNARH